MRNEEAVMRNATPRSRWVTGTLIFFTPIMCVFFLGSQMALSQVKRKFEAYGSIPEVTHVTELVTLPPAKVVMLRGRISEASCQLSPCAADPAIPALLIYQERPTDGREVRFQEKFVHVLPRFVLDLPDGHVVISPSPTRQHVIQHTLHTVSHGDRQLTGFRLGDVVTVQGQWQPGQMTSPTLVEVTGITSSDKQSLMQDWQTALQKVRWARNLLGFLTGLGIVVLIAQLRRTWTNGQTQRL
jgi:hypothetical protein